MSCSRTQHSDLSGARTILEEVEQYTNGISVFKTFIWGCILLVIGGNFHYIDNTVAVLVISNQKH